MKHLPIGNTSFSLIRKEDSLYVDKTDLIYNIAIIKDRPIFISRPRRFGKSLLVNILHCLFSNGLEYFKGLAIENLWHDKTYRVIHIDFSIISSTSLQEFIKEFDDELIQSFCLSDSFSQFDAQGNFLSPNRLFSNIIRDLPNRSIVLLIDEYDSPLIHHLDNYDELDKHLRILNDFYSTVKRYNEKFRFRRICHPACRICSGPAASLQVYGKNLRQGPRAGDCGGHGKKVLLPVLYDQSG